MSRKASSRIHQVVVLKRRTAMEPVVLSQIQRFRYRAAQLLEELSELYPAAVLVEVPRAVSEAASAAEMPGWSHAPATVECRQKRDAQRFGHPRWHFWNAAAERAEIAAWLAHYPVTTS